MEQTFIKDYIDTLYKLLREINKDDIIQFLNQIYHAYKKNKKIFIIGNGGSAAISLHFVCDIAKGCAIENKPRVKAISLVDNISLITAISNDINYESIFVEQLKNLLEPEEVIIAISSSGNSPNVVEAAKYGKKKGAKVLALVGFKGGKLKELSDIVIHAPVDNYQLSEDIHLILAHIISLLLKSRIKNENPALNL